jgi:hypothetical protein
LPSGVTLATPVRPDKACGESSKTVEDALKSLLVSVKDNVIIDALGHEVRFASPGKAAEKSQAKMKGAQVIIHLAN